MSSYYWQCDSCHVQGYHLSSMDEAKDDFAHHSAQHHGHHVAFVNDASEGGGDPYGYGGGHHAASYYWQCDDCHVRSNAFDSMEEAKADKSYQPAHSHHHLAYVVDAS